MMISNQIGRFRRAVALALLLGAFSLACSSDDKRPLVLVQAPLGGYATTGKTVQVTVTTDSGQVTQKTLAVASDGTGNIGVYLPSGTSGNATVFVSILDANGCVIATGTGASLVKVSPGETSTPITITLVASTTPCGLDGGLASNDGATQVSDGASAWDTVAKRDGSASPVDLSLDLPPADLVVVADGPDDAASSGPDTMVPPGLDAVVDQSVPDSLPIVDAVSDGPVDAAVSVMTVFSKCATYTHSVKNTDGTTQDWGIRRLLFTPDGNNLVSVGEDSRAKVWNVTSAGLSAPTNGIVFKGSGDYVLAGGLSFDGANLALGDTQDIVQVYDLASSISLGSASLPTSLTLDSSITPTPERAAKMQFTTDGTHLIAVYAGNSPDPNLFVVWDLTTQQIVRKATYDYQDWPYAILPGAYTASMWVASAMTETLDGGGAASVVSLVDISTAEPRSKVQFAVPGTVVAMAYSPDGSTLAIGTDEGEIGLWDISNKGNIARLGSPLVTASSSGSIMALAYSGDGKYLAAGTDKYQAILIQLQPKLSTQLTLDYLPWTVAFTADNQGLAVGERDYGVILYCHP